MASDAVAATMILNLLLVFLNLTIQLVGQIIHRGIQIRVRAFDKDILTWNMQGDFGLLVQLLDAQHNMHVDDVIEMARDLLQLLAHVFADSGADFQIMTTDLQIHTASSKGSCANWRWGDPSPHGILLWSGVLRQCPQH